MHCVGRYPERRYWNWREKLDWCNLQCCTVVRENNPLTQLSRPQMLYNETNFNSFSVSDSLRQSESIYSLKKFRVNHRLEISLSKNQFEIYGKRVYKLEQKT